MNTWRGTANGIEAVAARHNDLTLFLDEIAEVSAHQVAEVAYMLGNGEGKKRATQTGGARNSARWRLLFASTGEVTMAAHAASAGHDIKAGVEVRCPNIEADAGAGYGVFSALHDAPDSRMFSQQVSDAAEANYGHPIRAFLKWLVDEREDVEADLPEFISDFIATNASRTSAEVQRIAKRFAMVGAAGELATQAGVTGWQAGAAIEAAQQCFESCLKLRGTTGESDTAKGVHNVIAFLEKHGSSRFEDLGSGAAQRIYHRAGFVRKTKYGHEYLILADVFRNEICKGADHAKVARELAASGMLRHDKGRWTKKEALSGLGKKNVYVVACEDRVAGEDQNVTENIGNSI